MRTYFVNFLDMDGNNEGCAVIDVDENEFSPDEIAHIMPQHVEALGNTGGAHWLALITLKVMKLRCHPITHKQGQIAAVRIDQLSDEAQRKMRVFPKNILISKEEAINYGCVSVSTTVKNGKVVNMERADESSAWDA